MPRSRPDRVKFVDKNNARRLCLGLIEQISHARSADADEHFDKVAAAERKEGYLRFASDRLGDQRFARPRRSDE